MRLCEAGEEVRGLVRCDGLEETGERVEGRFGVGRSTSAFSSGLVVAQSERLDPEGRLDVLAIKELPR